MTLPSEVIISTGVSSPLTEALAPLVQRVVLAALEFEGIEGVEISVVLTDDAAICTLNQTYRGIDRPTDVLSFPLEEPDTPGSLGSATVEGELLAIGDIVISIERAQSQAEEYGHSLEREMGFLAAHGVLHLLGYDHEERDDAADMERRQETILGRLELTRE